MGNQQGMIVKTTLRPGQKGTKRLVEKYGERLLCVRYRYDTEASKRYTTVELLEEQADWSEAPQENLQQSRSSTSRRLGVRIGYGEIELRETARSVGAIWRPRQRLWEMSYEDVVALGLESRVVDTGNADGA